MISSENQNSVNLNSILNKYFHKLSCEEINEMMKSIENDLSADTESVNKEIEQLVNHIDWQKVDITQF